MAIRFILIFFIGLILTMVILTAPDGTLEDSQAGAAQASAAEVARMQELERQAVAQSLAQTPKAKVKPVEPAQADQSALAKTTSSTPAKPIKSNPKGRTVTVQSGDSLSSIAKRVYGSATKWRLIYEANRSKLTAPDALKVGMVLKVPERSIH